MSSNSSLSAPARAHQFCGGPRIPEAVGMAASRSAASGYGRRSAVSDRHAKVYGKAQPDRRRCRCRTSTPASSRAKSLLFGPIPAPANSEAGSLPTFQINHAQQHRAAAGRNNIALTEYLISRSFKAQHQFAALRQFYQVTRHDWHEAVAGNVRSSNPTSEGRRIGIRHRTGRSRGQIPCCPARRLAGRIHSRFIAVGVLEKCFAGDLTSGWLPSRSFDMRDRSRPGCCATQDPRRYRPS